VASELLVPTGRLAPTPSGRLHLGNALAFGVAWLSARRSGGRLLLRIEDIDQGRSREGLVDDIRRDLDWLGLSVDEETPRQSTRDHRAWLRLLDTYRCVCTRRELSARPCPCRDASHADGAVRFRLPPGEVSFTDRRYGLVSFDPHALGDPILVRRDGLVAYPLAVVVDDLTDGVSEVVRGADLLSFTAAQIRLWEALGATPPTWLHSPLLLGPDGKKLSKSHGSTEIAALREAGWSPARVWGRLLPLLGIHAGSLDEAIPAFEPTGGVLGPVCVADEG
jgi:glutamyl-tRNA synthetase